MASGSPAPHKLDLVIAFVNTLDAELEVDELASVEGVQRWFERRGLLGGAGTGVTPADRREAITMREALRSLMRANNGAPPDAAAAAELESAARQAQLGVHFAPDGKVELRPGTEDFAGSLGRLLIPMAEAAKDGTWSRVKACRAEDCQWAFYDRSRNRSGVWCDMAVCGNRTKVRAYRARQPQSS